MAHALRSSTDYAMKTTPQDPILKQRAPATGAPSKHRYRIAPAAEASRAPDTFVEDSGHKGKLNISAMTKGVTGMLKRHTKAFQVVGVEDSTLRQLASKCGDAAVTYNEVMAFLGAQGYEEFMTDTDSSVLMVMMRKSAGAQRRDVPEGLQQNHAFVRRLPFRSCVTY
ncbi:unnamed protein product [Ostreobium quekettii]|uniref:Uncharacterized protein n=1 Tax=Ostreobium quekettii TaxID=121088 RepID=A0A8S1IRW4_9CHLO|nr:unnamed protein product [Ostreobium quekettii]|eukprot:evm.model.scf_103EXC.6 EVM.evm.TU.scf_103EXC.6   scf_103EXC:74708-75211(+)